MSGRKTENLFQNNRQDVSILQSKDGRQRIVELHVEAIKNDMNEQAYEAVCSLLYHCYWCYVLMAGGGRNKQPKGREGISERCPDACANMPPFCIIRM